MRHLQAMSGHLELVQADVKIATNSAWTPTRKHHPRRCAVRTTGHAKKRGRGTRVSGNGNEIHVLLSSSKGVRGAQVRHCIRSGARENTFAERVILNHVHSRAQLAILLCCWQAFFRPHTKKTRNLVQGNTFHLLKSSHQGNSAQRK